MSHRSSSDRFLWDEVNKLSNEMKQTRDEVMQLRKKMKQMGDEVKPLTIESLRSHPILEQRRYQRNNYSCSLTRQEVKQIIKESIPNPRNIWSIRNIFAQSYVNGFRELVNERLSVIVKIVWCSILCVNLILLTRQITEIAKDYAEEVTITQISQNETNLTELNRPSICFTIFPDFLYRWDNRSSLGDLVPLDNDSLLYLGYIKAMLPHFASSGLWLTHVPRENITWSQFQSLGARSWISMTPENASFLSQMALYDSLYHWGIGQLNAENDSKLLSLWHPVTRSSLPHAPKFYSDVLTRFQSLDDTMQYYLEKSWSCVAIDLSTNSYVSPSGTSLKWFIYGYYYGEPANLKMLHEMEFSVIHFNTKHYVLDYSYADSFLDPDTVYKRDTISYTLLPTKFEHQNLSRQKCYDAKGEIYPRGYGETICFHDCMWDNHARLFNCSFWEDFHEHPSMKVCHIFDIFNQIRSHMAETCLSDGDQGWCNNETSRSVDEWNGLILQMYRDKVINEAHMIGCKQKCSGWMFCDEWEFEYGLRYKHDTAKQTLSGSNWSGNEMYREYTVSNFISVNKEVLKASLEEFMANLGGTIGLYFGFSICGCLHLLLFLGISCCGKVLRIGKRKHIQVAQPNTTDTSDNSKNVGMVEIEQIQKPIEVY